MLSKQFGLIRFRLERRTYYIICLFIKFASGLGLQVRFEFRGQPGLEKCRYLLHMAARAWPRAADGSKWLLEPAPDGAADDSEWPLEPAPEPQNRQRSSLSGTTVPSAFVASAREMPLFAAYGRSSLARSRNWLEMVARKGCPAQLVVSKTKAVFGIFVFRRRNYEI